MWAAASAALAAPSDDRRAAATAGRVTIARDDWGIPHIEGRTDADAVFGMIFAQAEDDFARIERNYAANLGRLAAADGPEAVFSDLRARLYYPEERLRALHGRAPEWLRGLTEAWADALNFWLARHPEMRPRYIARFEPWMAFAFTEGSIGGDIEEIDPAGLRAFYGRADDLKVALLPRTAGQASNGIAIAPKLTAAGHALLLINPHTTHYFRSEAGVRSAEGLNAYGASTWGQFFVYQGFNDRAGWMHTSSTLARVGLWNETVEREGTRAFYRYGAARRAFRTRVVEIAVAGAAEPRRFTAYFTHRGPVIGGDPAGTRWLSFAMMDRPVAALEQSFLRTKARNYAAFRREAARNANSSNDTVFADADGVIALDLPEFVARRTATVDYAKPVDGADTTDWRGEHRAAEIPRVVNPASGFVFNVNDGPWEAAGRGTLKREAFPAYMDAEGLNARTAAALRLLPGSGGWTAERLRAAAFDPHQPGFAATAPALVAAWDAEPPGARKERLAGAAAALRAWNFRWGAESVAQTIATFAGEAGLARLRAAGLRLDGLAYEAVAKRPAAEQMTLLEQAVETLTREHGRWEVPWGQVNRMRRGTSDVAVPFGDGIWGSLAVARARGQEGLARRQVDYGNSFVAVVEFGPRVKAMAVMAGGQSGDPASPHYFDQAELFAQGALRPVYFHADELAGHVRRRYHPGE